jgi:acetolactate synthase-1/2/3 large subunit
LGDGSVNRRNFLKKTAVTSAAVGLGVQVPTQIMAQGAATAPFPKASGTQPVPDATAEIAPPSSLAPLSLGRPAADFMVDVIKTLGIQYVAANPGSTFRGLQESLVNYGHNAQPEFITCCHEESSVAIAHGYFKIAGKPMAAMVHGTVGVQVLIISGNPLDANTRRVPVEWDHSVQDNAAIVRDFTKWDDTPVSLQHFAESMVRAAKLTTAIPSAPVMITAPMDLQEGELTKDAEAQLKIPKLSLDTPPQGDEGALREVAKLLANAERPVIVADRYARTERGMALLVDLAETVQAPVVDTYDRANFPSSHPLNQTERRDALVRACDLILALEPVDLWGMTHQIKDTVDKRWSSIISSDAKVVSIGTQDFLIRANYQEFQRYSAADISIAGDAETSLPVLIEMIRREVTESQKSKFADRRKLLEKEAVATKGRVRDSAATGWHLSPIHPARLAMEVWDLIKNEDWSVVGSQISIPSLWAKKLWPMDKPYCHTGGDGASGVGYGLPAAVGSALANRDKGRLSINFQGDGDFMYAPGALWTAAHHKIPLLTIMFNNRGYHQELMHVQVMACRHNRGIDRAGIGTTLLDPIIDYSQIARGMGVYAEGPVSDPNDLRETLRKAISVVKRGEPALVDVVSQPR